MSLLKTTSFYKPNMAKKNKNADKVEKHLLLYFTRKLTEIDSYSNLDFVTLRQYRNTLCIFKKEQQV